jgi:hypothetical protein
MSILILHSGSNNAALPHPRDFCGTYECPIVHQPLALALPLYSLYITPALWDVHTTQVKLVSDKPFTDKQIFRLTKRLALWQHFWLPWSQIT